MPLKRGISLATWVIERGKRKSEENGRGWREKRCEKKEKKKKSELFSIRDSGGVAFETL